MLKTSIIIPIYNPNIEFLQQALNSVLSQTLSDIEIIAIDDGSDNKEYFDLINNIQKDDKRLKFYTKHHEGSGLTRNVGITAAKGETIMFLDCDDYYPDNSIIETLFNILQENNVLIAGGKHKILVNNNELSEPYFNYGNIDDFFKNAIIKYVDYQFPWWYWCFIYNTKMIKTNKLFFPNFLRYQDPIWFVKTMCVAQEFYASDKTTYIHRDRDNRKILNKLLFEHHINGIAALLKYSDSQGLDKLHNLLYSVFYSYDIKLFDIISEISSEEKKLLINKITSASNKCKLTL